mgnify:CR=1 FL=1
MAVWDRTTLNDLFNAIQAALNENGVTYTKEPLYRDFRVGDVRHSQASVDKIQKLLGYASEYSFRIGIKETLKWYIVR